MPPRRHQILTLIYWMTVAGVFFFAAWRRFSLPLDPIADPDTWGYLSPAVHQLTGIGFVHEGRNFLYPEFLWILLRAFGDFRAITIAQHLLALAGGGLFLATWRRSRLFLRDSRLIEPGHDLLGLIATGVFLAAGEPIRAEMQLRPEAICAFLLSLNLYFAIGFISRTFVLKQKPAVGFGIGTALSAILLFSVKPSFGFMALVPLLPLGIFFLRRGSFRQKLALGIGIVGGGTILLLPDYFRQRSDDLAIAFLPTTLFVIHADLIRDQMADDLQFHARVPYSPEWLSGVHDRLTAEIAKSAAAEPEHSLSLGFSPDYLMYNGTSIAAKLGDEFGENVSPLYEFYRFYYWRVWQQRPLQMLRKIWRQFVLFYQPLCPAYDRQKVIKLIPWYELTGSSLDRDPYRETWKRYPPAVDFMRRAEMLSGSAPSIEQSKVVRRTVVFLAVMYLPLLSLTAILGALSLRWRDLRQRIGWLLVLALFIFAYNAAACLEVAVVHSLQFPRYLTVQFTITSLAEFVALWLVLETFLSQIRWGRPIQTSAPGE